MTGQELFHALSFVDERYVAEAETNYLGLRIPWMKIISVAACLCMNTAVSLLQKVFDMPQSVWNIGTAVLCIVIGTAFSALLGFLSAMYPAIKSAGLEPQSAITQGEVN